VKIGAVYPEIFDYICQFLAMSYQMYANKPCHLWSYQANVHQIFRRCSTIISAVNTQLDHVIAIRFLALVQRLQVVSVDVDNDFATLIRCHGNFA